LAALLAEFAASLAFILALPLSTGGDGGGLGDEELMYLIGL
jgi:hypothetical protein